MPAKASGIAAQDSPCFSINCVGSHALPASMDALWTLWPLFRPSSVHFAPGFLRCTSLGRLSYSSVHLPYIAFLVAFDVRLWVA